MVMTQELLINGVFFGGPCDSSVSKQVVHSPWSGSVVGVAAEAMWPEADAAIFAAVQAFASWKSTPRLERQHLLVSVSQMLRDRREFFAELMADEIAKPLEMGRAEVNRAALTLQLAAELLSGPEFETADVSYDPRGDGVTARILKEPVGPVFCITPYNWPINLAAHKIAPALAAGCTVVVKGSDSASLCTLALGKLMSECGFPPGVINFLNCEPSVAERIALDPRIRAVSFTGSPKVGWHLKSKVTDKRVCLELGGNATVILESTPNLDSVLDSITASAFGYAGQICISAQNLCVVEELYKDTVTGLIARLPKAGNPREEGVLCGPLISASALQSVQLRMTSAGGTVHGGEVIKPNLMNPAIIDNPHRMSEAVREEIFGPVLNVIPVKHVEEAIKLINSFDYGIHASIFSQSTDFQELAARELQVGGVVINDVPSLRFDNLPYGGIKKSGFGREGVQYAFDEFSEYKTVVTRG